MLILTAISVILFVSAALLYLREHGRLKKTIEATSSALSVLSDGLAQVSYGILHRKVVPPGTDLLPWAPEITGTLESAAKHFNNITAEPLLRMCYVGTDAWLEGTRCAQYLGNLLGGRGRVAVLVTSRLEVLIMNQRHRSFVTTMNEQFPGVTVTRSYEATADQQKACDFIKSLPPEIDAVYVTGNSIVPGAVRGAEESGKAGKLKILCHDLDADIARYITKGTVTASLRCSSTAQGRDAVLHLFNHIAAGWNPLQPRQFVPLELVDRSNLGEFWDEKKNALIEVEKKDRGAVRPLARPERKIRIAVILEDWNTAFLQMKSGAELAAEILAEYNVETIYHVLNQAKRPKAEVAAEAERLLSEDMEKGLHGISAYIGIPEMVPILNRCIEKGIPVVTFNSEPLSLRSMLLWLSKSSVHLLRFSNEYTAGHQDINTAMQDILATLNAMVGRVSLEAEAARSGAEAVNGILSLIEKTVNGEQHQQETVEASSTISIRMKEMTDFLNERISGLKTMSEHVKLTGEKISAMDDYGGRIRSIVDIIDGISSQTNVLAINAAIQASRSGEAGKGFKVIASEIRALADKSVTSTKDVTALIENMRSAVAQSMDAIRKTNVIVEEQVRSITAASEKITALSSLLSGTMGTVKDAAEESTKNMLRMRDSAGSMDQVVEKSSRIAVENKSAIETLGTTFTEITTQFNEMNNQTRQLEEIIKIMKNTVSQFSGDETGAKGVTV